MFDQFVDRTQQTLRLHQRPIPLSTGVVEFSQQTSLLTYGGERNLQVSQFFGVHIRHARYLSTDLVDLNATSRGV